MEKIELNWLDAAPIAHRGLHNNLLNIPENSNLSFEKAIQSGYAIELDVQVIADQEVIVFHDYTLNRLCGRAGKVSNLTTADLPLHSLLDSKQTIPSLEEVLKLVDGKVPLLIEIKRQPKIKNANMIILNSLLGYRGHLAIMSFDPFILWWFAKKAPLIPRGQLSSDFKHEPIPTIQKYILKNYLLNIISQPHFIVHNVQNLPNKQVDSKRKRGMKILGWTVSNQHEYQRVETLCDNIIFEGFNPLIKQNRL